jgi:DNA-binding PadR family transcriptional regulator
VRRRFGHGELHLVLLALLAKRPMHGYDLMNALAERMGRRYKPSPGSIYPAVAVLEAEGLIDAMDEGDRRVYALTEAGRQALDRRAGQLARIESAMEVRFGDDSVEVILARFAERVRREYPHVDSVRLEKALEQALQRLNKS